MEGLFRSFSSSPSPPPRTPTKAYSSGTKAFKFENDNSKENMPPKGAQQSHQEPLPAPTVQLGQVNLLRAPSSPVKVEDPGFLSRREPSSVQIEEWPRLSLPKSMSASENMISRTLTPSPVPDRLSPSPYKLHASLTPAWDRPSSRSSSNNLDESRRALTPSSSMSCVSQNTLDAIQQDFDSYQPRRNPHNGFDSAPQSREHSRGRLTESRTSPDPLDSISNHRQWPRTLSSVMLDRQDSLRPDSALSSGSEFVLRGRGRSPIHTPDSDSRAHSAHSWSASPDGKSQAYADLIAGPYPQAPTLSIDHPDSQLLQNLVHADTSLLSTGQTIEMYRSNMEKTSDPAIQYEFAVFLITCAQEMSLGDGRDTPENVSGMSRGEMLREARHILQKLSDRTYPFAQYYLADGYASGLFNKGKEDYDWAFPLFVSAAKHGHAEAGYRAALCYEFGWGTKVEANKAVQFYRQTASKNHPGAMLRLGRACLTGDMGLRKTAKEGVKWLKRAAESADYQYNSAPYELGLLHETGFGHDVFRDESYTAQLFTKSADLGHAEANYRMGDAYEHGRLNCPKDPAMSLHFYTGAAQLGHAMAMMALCAWYLVGADPVLAKDEHEAFEWAKKAADAGLPKAEYAVGYFFDTGMGCRIDPAEAKLWYTRAAEHGDERARHRLAAMKETSTGTSSGTAANRKVSKNMGADGERRKKFGIF